MSTKATTQPGRRTPLSLTGAVSKGQPNKGGSNASNNNGNNANGHTSTTNNKQDNKLQQQKTEQQKSNNSDVKENPNNKRVQQQADKKQQQQQNDNKKSIEKNQNGVNNSKQQQQQQQQAYENKQNQQPNKESKQQNGNNKLNENDKKEKTEKQQDKTDKLETKSKENKISGSEVQENTKKEEKKAKELKDTKEEIIVDKDETVNKVNEKTQNELHEDNDDKKSKVEQDNEFAKKKLEEEKTKEIQIAEEQQQLQQKTPPATPKTNRANNTLTSVNKTPTEKTPQKLSNLNSATKTTPTTKREVTTTIDDVEMEPLTVENSPIKSRQSQEVANINITPSATSTPGKIALPKRSSGALKSDVQLAIQSGYSPERPRAFSQISGRKSIRPITDYTPSKFQNNSQFRESYRRINTELDITNTSMNVTVGSEVPNNLSFSFFGRGRKRDHTPPQHSQSAIGELHTDMEVSPPKKPRFESFFNVVSSPLTLLRSRFSKATLQSSTPVKLEEKLNTAEDEIEVQNVSGVSVHEDFTKNEKEAELATVANTDISLDEEFKDAKLNISATEEGLENKEVFVNSDKACGMDKNSEQTDIKVTETPLQVAVGDPLAKNKRCVVM